MTKNTITVGGLAVDEEFYRFCDTELLPAIGVDSAPFWQGVEKIVEVLTPKNRKLLERRDELQHEIDEWHRANPGAPRNPETYAEFLASIGYLDTEAESVEITTGNVDPEIAAVPGPQLVVPVDNARFALNAANARWGSLYDALYGTDVIDTADGKEPGARYNPRRGAAVIEYAASFLDQAIPLEAGSHRDVRRYGLESDGNVSRLVIELGDDVTTGLVDSSKFIGYASHGPATTLLFRNNGLHIELILNPEDPIGREARANLADIVLESAVTTIQDCEDSVAAVDAEDKTLVYRNWFGLMQGTLNAAVDKGGRTIERCLAEDRQYTSISGEAMELPGRSLMLVRNVGHLMRTDTVRDRHGDDIFEGILDAIVTTGAALNDIAGRTKLRNSRTGSIYIVKPKMHGPDEAAFTGELMSMVEDLYELPQNTIKIGVMDEERRTTVNLAACIATIPERLVFINTGFLDRTGDEIHTIMHAGPVLPKEAIKSAAWIRAYEDRNVDVGIHAGLPGRAQIGKGMFPKTDEMREMVETKHAHPEAGANCAWVPSPTAASLHAMHYHRIDVFQRQRELAKRIPASIDDILTPPLGDPAALTADEIQQELDNNAQSILGYVVRWIDFGIGCSKVPDISGVNLMEDRATLRISSQHIANWLLHDVCSEEQVEATFLRMASVVDEQNAHDPDYDRMSDNPEHSVAFQAARALVFEGLGQPNGYTEPLLHAYRRRKKERHGV